VDVQAYFTNSPPELLIQVDRGRARNGRVGCRHDPEEKRGREGSGSGRGRCGRGCGRGVGRPLGVASTTKNRVLILDREDRVVRAYGPNHRPRFVATGKKGTKRPSQTRIGWDEGTIVRLEIPGEHPIEIDILAAAVPVLVGWSGGEDVSRLTGPIPLPESI
jgi:hypothetical protein